MDKTELLFKLPKTAAIISLAVRAVSARAFWSEDDLHACFDESVQEMADANGLSREECYAKLEGYYDGCHFRENSADIYNPFSLYNALDSQRFKDYWYETGTSTFVFKALRNGNFALEDLTLKGVSVSALPGGNTDDSDPIPVLCQSGYLTIKSYDERWERYSLKYSNKEVERGFMEGLAKQSIPFTADPRKLFKIGVSFSTKTRRIEEWKST